MKKLIVLALLLLVLGTAFVMSWECDTGSSCHALMQHDSTMYVLCADGELDLIENGKDSWQLECRSHVYMPVIGNSGDIAYEQR